MSRLIAYGCSNTFGEGLPDCWDAEKNVPLNTPSKYAWPNVLANQLNVKCVNLSMPGVSNKYICNEILETDLQKDDIVIVLWTFYTRHCMFNNDGSVSRILVQDMYNKNISKSNQRFNTYWYKNFFTDTDAIKDMYVRINLAKYYLDSKGIKNYHYSCDKSDNNGNKDLSTFPKPKWSSIYLPKIVKYFRKGVALDNMHPGVESHKTFAEELYKDLQK